MRFQGVVYRAHDPRWAFSPLSGEGAARTGGRFNRPGQAALYTALSMPAMIKEAQQGFARKLDPLTIVSYDVDCENVVDLTDHAELRRLTIEAAELAAAWRPLPGARQAAPTWTVADRLIREGYAAAIVSCYAPGATAQDRNIVFWRWGPELPHPITVYDPQGRLPQNQSSRNETSRN